MALFQSDKRGDIHWIECPKKIDGIAMKQFEALYPLWLQAGAKRFLLDFAATDTIQRGAVRSLVNFFQRLKAEERQWGSLNLSETLAQELRDQGVLQNFRPLKDVSGLLDTE